MKSIRGSIHLKLFLPLLCFITALIGYGWFVWMPHTETLFIEHTDSARAAFEENIAQFFYVIFGLLSIFLCVSGSVLYLYVLRPTILLARASKAMIGGDYSVPLPKAQDDEMGVLIRRFSNMRETINNTTHELAEALENARLLEATVVNAKDGVMITTADLENGGPEILYVNDSFTRITGYEADEVIGKTPRILQGENTDREELERLKETLMSGKPFSGELLNYTKDGDEYWLDINITPIRDASGVVTHFTAIERNITERKRFEDELQREKELAEGEIQERLRIEAQVQEYTDKLELIRFEADEARKKAEASNEAKTQFLANMSHELRTPMNGIIGLSSLLLESKLNETDMECIHSIHSSADGLLALLNDLLDFSKIEAGELTLEYNPMSVKDCIQQVFDVMHPLASRKTLQLNLTYSPSSPVRISGDASRVRQVLYNLIGNAIKFTESGSVRVDVSSYKPAYGDHGLWFRVEDTGIGIPENIQQKVFEKFTQADVSTARKYGGTGLGLAITKQLVEAMGGEIGVDSIEGRGSTFWFKIPVEVIESENEDEQEIKGERSMQNAAQKFENYRALIVDDHPVNILFAQKLMEKLGFDKVETAYNGKVAVEAFKKEKFDIVIMDCQMPEMDGYEATQEIRTYEFEAGLTRTPIIAITADAIKGAQEKCLSVGMDDYLTKPIDRDKLVEVLEAYLDIEKAANENLRPDVRVDNFAENVEVPLDYDHLELFTDGDPEEEKQLLDLFFEQTELGLQELEKFLKDNDPENWKKSAHRMKGAAANLGAGPLSEVCKMAEDSYDSDAAFKEELISRINNKKEELQSFIAA